VGSGLIETSLLGSDPISGARFFGAGNELTAVLAVELLVALAAVAPRRRQLAWLVGGGVLTTLVLAWGRAGANVGAVFTVGGAVGGAVLVLVPGAVRVRRGALAALALGGVLALVVAIDLGTGGGAQLTSEVIRAPSPAAVLATLGRRLHEAWLTLREPAVAVAVLAVVLATGLAAGARERLLARVPQRGYWAACLVGVLAGSLLGSFAADSGPRVLLVGAVGAACVLAYLHGEPVAGEAALMRRLAALSTLLNGSGFPRPDPPNLMRR
jgi:hypothetical protein